MKSNHHNRSHRVLALTTLFAAASAAATPETVLWSARVEDGAGPVSGTVSLTLTLFDAETGGSSVHEESVTSAVVVDGELVHELGATAGNPLDDAVLDHPSLFLQVVLNGETLSPRLPIRAVPYALRAEQCRSLDGLSADDLATDAELAAAVQSVSVPFSSLTGIPAGLADGELTASAGGGLVVSGNRIGIDAGAVTAAMLGSSSVTSAKIAADAVGQAAIQANAVGSGEIIDSSIAAADLAANAVASSEIVDRSIAAVDIASNAITGNEIANGTVRDTDVTGVRLYQYAAGCSNSNTLLLSSTCSTTICAGGMTTQYFTCAGSCTRSSAESCSNTYVGTLVK